MSFESKSNEPEILSQDELLDAVNKVLKQIGADSKVTPKYIQKLVGIMGKYHVLAGRRILLVDDMANILEALAPLLTVATHGKAEYLLHQGEDAATLCNEIVGLDPEYVLMDFSLAGGLKGDSVVQKLLQTHPAIQCIGFSSEKQNIAFSNAGAIGSVEKITYDNESMIKEIAQLVSRTK